METPKKKIETKSTVGKKGGSELLLSPRERGKVAPIGILHRTVIPTIAKGNWWLDRKDWTKKKK